MKTIYVAGKVRGLPFQEVREKFENKTKELRAAGYMVRNPVALVEMYNNCQEYIGGRLLNDGNSRNETLRFCLKQMLDCDGIYLLPDWKWSEGAKVEKWVAERVGMTIMESR